MRKGYKMISNQILQNTMEGLKNISKVDMGVLDVEGKVLVSTFPESEIAGEEAAAFAQSPADSQTIKNYQFLRSMTSISWSTYLLPRRQRRNLSGRENGCFPAAEPSDSL